MAKKISAKGGKKAIEEAVERLKRASVSPEERLKLLKEMNSFVKKTDKMVKGLISKVKKA